MNPFIDMTLNIPATMAGYRLDKALAELLPEYSRARLQQWIQAGQVQVNAQQGRNKDKLQGGESIQISVQVETEVSWHAQDLPLNILYEDEAVLVVNKPAGLVVHPGAGTPDNTLVNALLNYAPELAVLPRAGIIHRLDKDTSGVLVVARQSSAHTHLVAQLQAHQFSRTYQAVVIGVLIAGATIDAPIGRHPHMRTRMAVVDTGKPAVTHYRIIQRYRAHTHIRVQLETGRTHQIRVHMAHQRYPLVGDPVYGQRLYLPPGSQDTLKETLRQFPRQALHAHRLGFQHPQTQQWQQWVAPLPEDMRHLLSALQADLAHSTPLKPSK
ncbi:MAG: 23S rRNA pseudouridine(1911/1915/1917) synthase RluD [Pseudomonadota bacterium]|nr:23S rRNA pseudouridine(1911/1915/1917) synthase RluD [Pseudomonadota bacterium]